MIPTEERMGTNGVVTTVGGSWSGNTRRINGRLAGFRIAPTTSTTVYNFRIVDKDDFELVHRKGLRGEYVETLTAPPVIRGIATCYIEVATANEPFKLLLFIEGQ